MGFRKFIGKVFGGSDSKDDNSNTNSSTNTNSNTNSGTNTNSNTNSNVASNSRNFRYLDNLIHDDSRVIKLDSDIILDDSEAQEYAKGIMLDRNYLAIEGNGHSIDAKNMAGIFTVTGKQIQMFNINFVNASGMGALVNSCEYDDERYGLTLTNCSFKDNSSTTSGGAIKNSSPLKLVDTDFTNNHSDESGGAIANSSSLHVLRGNFTGNGPDSIFNEKKLEISDAVFSKTKDEEIKSTVEASYIGCTFKGESYQDDFDSIISGKTSQHNFYNLKKIVSASNREVQLDDDYFLKLDESLDYNDGITVSADNLTLDGCGHSIDANAVARIFNVTGKGIVFKNLTFRNSKSSGGGITIQKDADLKLINCTFEDNLALINGGAVVNLGNTEMIDCTFEANKSDDFAGAVLNGLDAVLDIRDSKFIRNSARDCAAIFNRGRLTIEHTTFDSNSSGHDCGAIANIDGYLEVKNSYFIKNSAERDGGAIINRARTYILDCLFDGNTSKSYAGAIFTETGSSSLISKGIFKNNSGANGSAIFNTSEDTKISECQFNNNNAGLDLIYNKGNLQLLDSKFKDNFSKGLIVFNDVDSTMHITGGEMTKNASNLSAIYNAGFCDISKFKFTDNSNRSSPSFELDIAGMHFDGDSADRMYSEDIYNVKQLSIKKIQLLSSQKTVLNRGHIDAFEFTQDEFDKHVHNLGTYKLHGITPHASFADLDLMIHGQNHLEIRLNEDILFNPVEQGFFEGGIELDVDGLVIDGCGRTIDGAGLSRIFCVCAKGVVIKNIVFSNGKHRNEHEQRSNGGGALKILKDASLKIENCIFKDSTADDGGAILNNGEIISIKNRFEGNSSGYCGGAVFNRNVYTSLNDEFHSNESKIAGAIYNEGDLTIEGGISLSGNLSNLPQAIYNANSTRVDEKYIADIYDAGFVNRNPCEAESFAYLNECILQSKSVILQKDIVFDYIRDFEFLDGIRIDDDVTVEGNGHCIDGAGLSSLFNVTSNVVFRNVVFMNAHSNGGSVIENTASLKFEGCRFLNNRLGLEFNLVDNHGKLQIDNCEFLNNFSRNKSLINNDGELEMSKSYFINNQSRGGGTCLYNAGKSMIRDVSFETNSSQSYGIISNGRSAALVISNSIFANNSSDISGSALVNWGQINLDDSMFTGNSSRNNGGAIINGGKFDISSSKFQSNSSGYSGGAIFNDGEMNINSTLFKDNESEMPGNSIYAMSGRMELSDSEFTYDEKKEIASEQKAEISVKNCRFGD